MDALISGHAGLALVVEGSLLASIHAEAPERTVPRRQGEFHHLSRGARDFLVLEDVTREEVVRQLLLAQDREDALRLALIAQDPELAADIRSEAIQDLEDLFAENRDRDSSRLRRDLEYVLYAHPLPNSMDLGGAIQHALRCGALEVADLLERFGDHQEAIDQVRRAWEAIPLTTFGDAKDAWQATAVREGLFHELASRLATATGLRRLPPHFVLKPALQALPNVRELLNQWHLAIRMLGGDEQESLDQEPEFHEALRAVEDSIRRCKAMLEADLAQYGEEHPRIAKDRSELALVLRELGDPEAAAVHLRKALAIDVAWLGETLKLRDSAVAWLSDGEVPWDSLLSSVGEASLQAKKVHETARALRNAVEEFDRTLGPQHPLTTFNRALHSTFLLKQAG